MNEREAEKQGYNYIGPLLSSYGRHTDLEIWEKDKKIAKQIKEEYEGADYVIATGISGGWLGTGSRAIFGNNTFNSLWSAIVYGPSYEVAISNADKAKARARLEYEKAIASIEADIKRAEDRRAWMNSIRKVK